MCRADGERAIESMDTGALTPTPMTAAALARRLQVGGTVNAETAIYVERDDDKRLAEYLSAGEYCNVLTSRQMGKSSLIVRLEKALRAKDNPTRTAVIDITVLGTAPDPEVWFIGFLKNIQRGLKFVADVDALWLASRVPRGDRLITFFREVVLGTIQGPIVVFVDEIDKTKDLNFTDDFFWALRSMYNDRTKDPEFRRLTFCLCGVANPNDLIKNDDATPYNVGKTLELRDFDPARDDLSALGAYLSPEPSIGAALLRRVLYWTDGHPFLTTALCEAVQGSGTTEQIDQRVADFFVSTTRSHSVKVHFDTISRRTEHLGGPILRVYEEILNGKTLTVATPAYGELRLVGLVKPEASGALVIRNRVYARRFDRMWLRQTKAFRKFRRSVVLTNALWFNGLAVLVVGFFLVHRASRLKDEVGALDSSIRAGTSEEDAIADYRRLAGLAVDEKLKRKIDGHCDDANKAIAAFWASRTKVLRERAKSADPEVASLYLALASVKDVHASEQSPTPDAIAQLEATLVRASNTPPTDVVLALSPDGKQALTSYGGEVDVREVAALPGAPPQRFVAEPATSLAWGADGTVVIVRNLSDVDVGDKERLERLPLPEVVRTNVLQATLSPLGDGTLVATQTQLTFVCGRQSKVPCASLPGWTGAYAQDVPKDASIDAPWIVTGGAGQNHQQLQVFDRSRRQIPALDWSAPSAIVAVALQPDGRVLAAWNADDRTAQRAPNLVTLDPKTSPRRPLVSITTKYPTVNFVQFCGSDVVLVASERGGDGSAVERFDVSSKTYAKPLGALDVHGASFRSVDAACTRVLGYTSQGAVRAWRLAEPEGTPPPTPASTWEHVQRVLARTLDGFDNVVDLTGEPNAAHGPSTTQSCKL